MVFIRIYKPFKILKKFRSAVAFFFLFFLHGTSIGTRQQGISYNIGIYNDRLNPTLPLAFGNQTVHASELFVQKETPDRINGQGFFKMKLTRLRPQ